MDELASCLEGFRDDGQVEIEHRVLLDLRRSFEYPRRRQPPPKPHDPARPVPETIELKLPARRTKPTVKLYHARAQRCPECEDQHIDRLDLMIIGPKTEFEGGPSTLLDNMLKAVGWLREGEAQPVSPPAPNRPPPLAVLSLGPEATHFILGDDLDFMLLLGKWQPVRDTHVMPLYAPSYMREHEVAKKRAWKDLRAMMNLNHLSLPPWSKPFE